MAMTFFCPFTKRLRTDDKTKFFLRRLGFHLTSSQRSACQVPVLVDAQLLARELELHCPPLAAASGHANGKGPNGGHRIGVSQRYRRLVRNALGETYVDLLSLRPEVGSRPPTSVHGCDDPISKTSGPANSSSSAALQRTPLDPHPPVSKSPDALSALAIAVHGFVDKELDVHLEQEPVNRDRTPTQTSRSGATSRSNASCDALVTAAPVASPLNDDQQSTMSLCLDGRNVYVGGNAGTGKSFLLTQIAKALAASGKQVLVTAMTGIAAMHIEGTTLHHALGVSPPHAGALYGPDSIRGWHALRTVDVLMVDEVSMLDASLLCAMDAVARRLRGTDRHFGGMQVILSGDFLQLEPTHRNVLHAPLFHEAFLQLGLAEPMRQRDDLPFLAALNALRVGQLPQCIKESAVLHPEDKSAVHLYPTRRCAQMHNARMMARLPSPEVVFRTTVRLDDVKTGWTEAVSIRLFAQRPTPSVLKQLESFLRAALVSECRVDPDEFAFHCQRDATLSTVTVLLKGRSWGKLQQKATVATMQSALHSVLQRHHALSKLMPVVASLPFGRTSRSAIIREAFRSIEREPLLEHKALKVGCRVMLIKNLTDTLVNGSLGVIERFGVLEDPETTALVPPSIRLQRCSRKRGQVPVVRFDGIEALVAIPWIVVPSGEDGNEAFVRCNFRTMPLIAAYAFTVHKVQGVTLNTSVLLDCERMWPCPHLVYVAASRVRKLSQLRIVNLREEHVTVSPTALEFSRNLCRASDVAAMAGNHRALSIEQPRIQATAAAACPLID